MKTKIDKEHLANIKLLKKHGYSDENIKNMDILQITEIALELEPQYTNPHIEEMKRLSDEFFSKYLINSKQGEDKMKSTNKKEKQGKLLRFYYLIEETGQTIPIEQLKPIKWSEFPPTFKLPNWGEFTRELMKEPWYIEPQVIYCKKISRSEL